MTNRMKQFIFLYPLDDILRFEVEAGSYPRKGKEVEMYARRYSALLNKAIDLRYRHEGFGINYAVFDNTSISEVIKLKEQDRVIKVGISVEKHRQQKKYPNPDFILNQLGNMEMLRVAGFHLWDCVDRLARRAHRRGIDVLVDEDLTELFKWRLDPEICPAFRVDTYPTCIPKDDPIRARAKRPWLVQPQKHL